MRADDWRMFGRSQSRNAVSPEKDPPTFWQLEEKKDGKVVKPSKNIRWTQGIGGGWGSYFGSLGDPVVVDGHIWIGSNARVKDEPHYSLVCLEEKTGKLLHRYSVPVLRHGPERFLHTMGSSPLIEGDRMWFFNNNWDVVCLDLAPLKNRKGEPRELWKVDTFKTLGVYRTKSIFDCRLCSVAIHGDWLYVITGNGINTVENDTLNVAAPSLVCFNKNTGKIVWQDNSPGKDIMHSQFASPTIITVNGKTQVVAPQGDGWVRSFDAATGKLIWKFDTNPPDAVWKGWAGRSTRNYLPATAVFHDNKIFIGNGHEPAMTSGPAWLYSIDATKTGDLSPQVRDDTGKSKLNPSSGLVWKYGGLGPNKKPVFYQTLSNVAIDKGLLIAGDGYGYVHCLDARTGAPHWSHDTKAQIEASPLIVDGKVFVADNHVVTIFELARKKKIINQIEMDGALRASPVFANGVLYIAAGHLLYAIADPRE